MKSILMLAAENGALPQGKVGGMGDVIRDLPRALVAAGLRVTVMTPAYGAFANRPGAKRQRSLDVPFAGTTEQAHWYALPDDEFGVSHHVVDHPRFTPCGAGRIYCVDGDDAPFYSDATKFAFFSATGAAAARLLRPDVVHLHDWHLGPYLALRAYDRTHRMLKDIRTVFTIHNLALQGIRPLAETDSSWEAWFPWLHRPAEAILDPEYSDCVNPMAMAIRLADAINTVSPTYAEEVLRPNDAAAGFRGGERLEKLLNAANAEGRLVGILNGCDYDAPRQRRPGWKKLLEIMSDEVERWIAADASVASAHYLAERRLAEIGKRRPRTLLTSIGRITEQKVSLFRQPVRGGVSALERILSGLGEGGLLIVLGSGDPALERFFTEMSVANRNLLFLRGYSEPVASALYAAGDIFLMPSSFEPCGISQMLAMRYGQPCVVHAVGGLRDTVTASNGFPFEGRTPRQQGQAFAREVAAAVDLQQQDQAGWKKISAAAAAARFDWTRSATRYIEEVYGFSDC